MIENYTIKQRTAGEELAVGRFSRRSQGHDSSESEGEEHVPPPKRQKVQVLDILEILETLTKIH